MFPLPFVVSVFALSAYSLPQDAHEHNLNRALPAAWYHAPDHPVHALFKRGGDGQTYPAVGSQEWSSAYPPAAPDTSKLPAAWVNALNAAVAAGTIPNISVSFQTAPGTNPLYPNNQNPSSPEICSATEKCRGPGDIWDAPDGFFGTGFDDGPQPPSSQLYDFLIQNNESVTHFMIGVNIINFPDLFNKAFNAGHDIAVHTWTHPYMTTLSNLEVVGQLGWTMELIHNSTGGRVPRYWRPPYGDSDNRVRAIAKQVFGLQTILWNQDTEDWSIGEAGGTTVAKVSASLNQWLTGPKSPGLIILEHELSNASVGAFMSAYPTIKQNGWQMKSAAQLLAPNSAWQNAASSLSDTVTPADILFSNTTTALSPPSPSGTSGNSSSPASNSTQSTTAGPTTTNKPSAAIQISASSIPASMLLSMASSLAFMTLYYI